MVSFLRKHAATMVVAGVTAAVMAGAPALGHLTESFKHLKGHIDKLSADNHLKYVKQTETVPANSFGAAEVVCPSGWHPTGGGWLQDNSGMRVWRSFPTNGTGGEGRRGWRISIDNLGGGEGSATVVVMCAKVDKTSGNFGG